MDSKIIGERIKLLMKNKKITATRLARELGISYPTLIKKLNGQSEFCNTEIIKITDFFKLDINLCANIFFNPKFNLEEKFHKQIS